MGRGCGRREASKRRFCHEPALDASSEGQACADVLFFEIRKVAEDLLVRHAGGEISENVIYGDPHPPDAGLTAPHIGIYRYALPVIHARSLRCGMGRFKKEQVVRSNARGAHSGFAVMIVENPECFRTIVFFLQTVWVFRIQPPDAAIPIVPLQRLQNVVVLFVLLEI